MNFEDILKRVKVKIHQPQGQNQGAWDDAEYLAVANDIMDELVNFSHCLDSSVTWNAVVNQGEYEEELDIAKVVQVYFKASGETDYSPLTRMSIEQLDTLEREGGISKPWRAERGDPTSWYKWNKVVGLFPIPDANGTDTLKKIYQEQATAMTVDESIPFNDVYHLYPYHTLIVYGMVAHFLAIDGEDVTMWFSMYERGKRSMKGEVNRDFRPLRFRLARRKRRIKNIAEFGGYT